jgi:hypothetical protein
MERADPRASASTKKDWKAGGASNCTTPAPRPPSASSSSLPRRHDDFPRSTPLELLLSRLEHHPPERTRERQRLCSLRQVHGLAREIAPKLQRADPLPGLLLRVLPAQSGILWLLQAVIWLVPCITPAIQADTSLPASAGTLFPRLPPFPGLWNSVLIRFPPLASPSFPAHYRPLPGIPALEFCSITDVFFDKSMTQDASVVSD